jgi:hypothetical protein
MLFYENRSLLNEGKLEKLIKWMKGTKFPNYILPSKEEILTKFNTDNKLRAF